MQKAQRLCVLAFSMKGTLTQDVSSASSTKDGDRRGERWNVCERVKKFILGVKRIGLY